MSGRMWETGMGREHVDTNIMKIPTYTIKTGKGLNTAVKGLPIP